MKVNFYARKKNRHKVLNAAVKERHQTSQKETDQETGCCSIVKAGALMRIIFSYSRGVLRITIVIRARKNHPISDSGK